MEKTNDVEYVFWLRNWRDKSISFWSRVGRFKCIITKKEISITSIENSPEKNLNVDFSIIYKCKVSPEGDYSSQNVEIFSGDRKITLYPVAPFDPNQALIGNHAEAQALANTINAIKSNIDPQTVSNPYVRQLEAIDDIKKSNTFAQFIKAEFVKFETITQNWSAHTSPWDYSDLYGDKFIYLKALGGIFVYNILLAIVVTAVLLLIVYLLALLHVI
ncbi:MAG: hypothetical protein IPP66_03335 [Anaerolineales bacterium]|nr:hypothetical protein [Anaerolineales bacterium]